MSTAVLRQLEACLQEELGSQARLLALLESQERALLSHERDALAAASEALAAEFNGVHARARRRDELIGALARVWSVAPKALTLASIVARAGSDGERLRRQRAELERVGGRVQKLARRTGAAARLHARLSNEIVRVCLASSGSEVDAGGAMVNAEA